MANKLIQFLSKIDPEEILIQKSVLHGMVHRIESEMKGCSTQEVYNNLEFDREKLQEVIDLLFNLEEAIHE